jgi:hypothetical protein
VRGTAENADYTRLIRGVLHTHVAGRPCIRARCSRAGSSSVFPPCRSLNLTTLSSQARMRRVRANDKTKAE